MPRLFRSASSPHAHTRARTQLLISLTPPPPPPIYLALLLELLSLNLCLPPAFSLWSLCLCGKTGKEDCLSGWGPSQKWACQPLWGEVGQREAQANRGTQQEL